MSRVLSWQKHIKWNSKVGNTLGQQEIYTQTICKNSNQFITSAAGKMEELDDDKKMSILHNVHAYIGCWDIWVTTRYIQLQEFITVKSSTVAKHVGMLYSRRTYRGRTCRMRTYRLNMSRKTCRRWTCQLLVGSITLITLLYLIDNSFTEPKWFHDHH